MSELDWQPYSGWTLWITSTNNLTLLWVFVIGSVSCTTYRWARPSPMLQRNFGFKTKLNIVWPSDFSLSYHVWAAELRTTCMHMASQTSIVAAVPKYGEHAWDYVIISWRHNLGATFLYFMFAIKEIFNVSWTLKIVSFPKFVMQFNYG